MTNTEELITEADVRLIDTLPNHLRRQAEQQIVADRVAMALSADRHAFRVDCLARAAQLAAHNLDRNGNPSNYRAFDRAQAAYDAARGIES